MYLSLYHLPSDHPYHIISFYHILSHLAFSDLSNYLQCICLMHVYIYIDIDSYWSDMYIFVYSIPPFGVLLHLLSFRVSQSIQGSLLQSNLHVTWEGFIKGSLWGEKLGKHQNQHFTLGWKDGGRQKNVTYWKVFWKLWGWRSQAYVLQDFNSGKSKSRIMTRYENAFRFRAWVCTPTIFLSNSLELVLKS